MPRIMKLFVLQTVSGFGLAAAFVALLLWFDVARIYYLATHTDAGLFAVILLWILNGSVFAAAQFGIALMRLGEDDGPRGGTRSRGGRMPARVIVGAERSQAGHSLAGARD